MKVLYEDNHILVVEKPVNIPSQADSSGDMDLLTLCKMYIKEKYHKPGSVYLGLVHRLDRPVGGVLVLARTSKAAARLSAQMAANTIQKQYLALVEGQPTGGDLCDYLLKDESRNISRVVPEGIPHAKKAVLSYEAVGHMQGLVCVRIRLQTGRSHQIRVQMAHAGYPLWGDMKYGNGQKGQQLALWAEMLTFTHPTTKQEMTFTSLPAWAVDLTT